MQQPGKKKKINQRAIRILAAGDSHQQTPALPWAGGEWVCQKFIKLINCRIRFAAAAVVCFRLQRGPPGPALDAGDLGRWLGLVVMCFLGGGENGLHLC